jgi:hypothetical protein
MTDQEKDKVIVLALGECWHDERDPIYHSTQMGTSFRCTKCGLEFWARYNHPSLATPEGFFWWFPRLLKKDYAREFIHDFCKAPRGYNVIPIYYVNDPTRGRDAAYRFFVGRSKGR